jgi:hypothetical protein
MAPRPKGPDPMQTKPSATLGKSYLQNPDTKKTKRLAKERPRGKQNRPGTPKSLIPGGGNPSRPLCQKAQKCASHVLCQRYQPQAQAS